jgi:hypothetical protein
MMVRGWRSYYVKPRSCVSPEAHSDFGSCNMNVSVPFSSFLMAAHCEEDVSLVKA